MELVVTATVAAENSPALSVMVIIQGLLRTVRESWILQRQLRSG